MRRIVSQGWLIFLLFIAWQLWVMSANYNSIVIVSPIAALQDIFLSPLVYIPAALWTLFFALVGLTTGMLIGLALAIVAWRSKIFAGVISPAAILLSSTPVVCLIPLVARIFGYRSGTEFVMVSVMTFFPSFVFASQGLTKLPPMASEYFAALSASRTKRLLLLALPASVPSLALALRVGAAYSVMVTMVSEYLMQTGGLGNMFALTSQAFETERAWGASLCAMALSAALYMLSGRLEFWVRARYL